MFTLTRPPQAQFCCHIWLIKESRFILLQEYRAHSGMLDTHMITTVDSPTNKPYSTRKSFPWNNLALQATTF